MTREELLARFRWDLWYTGAMIVNAGGMLPQILKLLDTQNSAGVSPTMFWIYLATQFASMVEGWRLRAKVLFWGMIGSMSVNLVTLFLIYHYASKGA